MKATENGAHTGFYACKESKAESILDRKIFYIIIDRDIMAISES